MSTPTKSRAAALATLTAPGADHELHNIEVNGLACKAFVNAPNSLRELYIESISDEEFFIFEDERYTFAEMYSQAARLAHCLVETYGIEKGDRVAISMRNYPEWVVGFTAATSIGAIAVAMNAWWETEEIEMGLKDSGAKVILADAERIARLAQIEGLTTQIISVRPQDIVLGKEFNEALGAVPENAPMPNAVIDPDDPATMFYTSGSTGFPKGAVASHRNILSALLSWELDGKSALLIADAEPPELPYQVATLLAVPLFHVTGSHAVYLSSYRQQRKMVSMYKWDTDTAAKLIESEKISSFVAPAAMTGDLVQAASRLNTDLSSLLAVGGGGAPRAPEQVKDIDDTFSTAMPNTGWGMTETNGIGTGIGGQDYLDRPASSGRVSAVLDLKIVDEEGNTLPQGQRGELLIRGTSIIKGYWDRPEANAETFVDGWLRTGDVAYLDEEGYLFIVDRIKDLIIRGGENIGCGEVEAALLEHPDILEASVYALPDERLGEEVATTVFCESALDEGQLRDFLVERLARFKIPRYINIQNQPLPRIASGKIFKRQMREDALRAIQN
ncbi:MAG: class I adenylate-forming enzyme family protein [Pseudomonadota bacterium]